MSKRKFSTREYNVGLTLKRHHVVYINEMNDRVDQLEVRTTMRSRVPSSPSWNPERAAAAVSESS